MIVELSDCDSVVGAGWGNLDRASSIDMDGISFGGVVSEIEA